MAIHEPTTPAHTPGPWHIDRESPHSPICIKPYPGRIVCDIVGTDAEAEANSRLIATAPGLLASLKAMIDAADEGEIFDQDHGGCDDCILCDARKAVAKAA